ncbi:MAG: RHS repeat-associated core domain-containing protein, partial [Ktedonobacteraceae bacterium]
GAVPTNKGFTGQYLDDSGLNYYNARYYDPVVGRFVSADTKQSTLLFFSPLQMTKQALREN